MEVILAKSAGFCFGVKRAVDLVMEKIEEGGSIYTLGPIIHNEEVVKDLAAKGVRILEYKEDGFYEAESGEKLSTEKLQQSTVIIRSHGVEKEVYEKLQEAGATIADATCPFVKKIHNLVSEESEKGKTIIIVGDAKHPEVQGICSYCKEKPIVLSTKEEAQNVKLDEGRSVCMAAQTTANYNKFQELVEILSEKAYHMNSVNTICNATATRQQEARKIASQVGCMIVIGGTHSSNSRKLYEICREECENTYFIQTLDDLHLDLPKSVKSVGITAGASTPNNIIEEVQSHVRTIF